jgi:hypothetical protein
VQAKRKEANLVPQDKIEVEISAPEREKIIIEQNEETLLKEFRAVKISLQESEKLEIQIKKI